MKTSLFKPKNFLLYILIIDVVVVALHLLFPEKSVFNLDIESNVPTIYQGVKVIFISMLSFTMLTLVYLRKKDLKKEWFWMFWGAAFLFLGLDEVGRIHENISLYMREIFGGATVSYEETILEAGYSSTPWLLYYVFLFIGASILVGIFIRKHWKKYAKNMRYLIIGWLLYLCVPVVEYINALPKFFYQPGYEQFILLEESLEILGGTFLLVFTYSMFRKSIKMFKL